jgi:nitrogen regulatory protein P-II 1
MHTPTYGSRTKIEVIVEDRLSNDIINELIKQLTRGSVSDGKIFVYDVNQAYDIGSGQKNEFAI